MDSLRAAAAAVLVFATAHSFAQGGPDIERGRYLVTNVGACGLCHFQAGVQGVPIEQRPMAGGFPFPGRDYRAVIPNITPDDETGIGKWSVEQVARAIREGVRPDGSIIGRPMPVYLYRSISDEDVMAMAAYLKSTPPVRNPVEKSRYDTPPPSWGPPVSGVKTPDRRDAVAYGAYLANIAHCMDCHTSRDANGNLLPDRTGAGGSNLKGPWGDSIARNLTPHESGLKNWTDAQIATSIRTGVNPQGIKYKPPMPFAFLKGMSDGDVSAVIAYLRSLPPNDYPR
jgi:mono/diheme cytochrome c family protein